MLLQYCRHRLKRFETFYSRLLRHFQEIPEPLTLELVETCPPGNSFIFMLAYSL